MATLQQLFVKVSTNDCTNFRNLYVSPAEGTERNTAYDSKVCFLEDKQEIFTQGKLYGLNNTADVNALKTYIGTMPDKADGSHYNDIIEFIQDLAAGEAKAASVFLTDDVIVAGGPLADDVSDNWPDTDGWTKNGNKCIPAGTNLQKLIEQLFLKPINGTVELNYTTWNPTLASPSASIDKTGTVEVGTFGTVTFAANDTVNNNSVSVQLKASQGYFKNENKTHNAALTAWTTKETVNGSKSGTATATATIKAGTSAPATPIDSGETFTIEEGTNTLSVSNSGITASHSGDFANDTYYASTNTKSKLTNTSVTVVGKTYTDKNLTSTNSASVTGARYMFWGGTSGDISSSADVRGVSNSIGSQSRANSNAALSIFAPAGSTTLIIAAPENTRSLKSILNVKASNAECTDSFELLKQPINVNGANNYTAARYDVWVYTARAAFEGGEEFKVTFSK